MRCEQLQTSWAEQHNTTLIIPFFGGARGGPRLNARRSRDVSASPSPTPLHSTPLARARRPRAPPSRPAPPRPYLYPFPLGARPPSTTLLTAHSCSCHPARRPQSMATASLALSLRLAPSSRPLSLRRRGAAGVTCRATTATFHQLDAVGECLCLDPRLCLFRRIGTGRAAVLVNY
jgi:hypothetical protein